VVVVVVLLLLLLLFLLLLLLLWWWLLLLLLWLLLVLLLLLLWLLWLLLLHLHISSSTHNTRSSTLPLQCTYQLRECVDLRQHLLSTVYYIHTYTYIHTHTHTHTHTYQLGQRVDLCQHPVGAVQVAAEPELHRIYVKFKRRIGG
jgi:4-amino-4-deoxy-L-arabinose transferase-like glycosyltransferase